MCCPYKGQPTSAHRHTSLRRKNDIIRIIVYIPLVCTSRVPECIENYDLELHSRGGAPSALLNFLMHDFSMHWWCRCFLNHEFTFAYRLCFCP